MAKLILISLNLFALLSFKLFFEGDVNVEQKIPETIKAGETFEVVVTIEKGDREGFAKWQQALPEGFIAEAKETEGATFSFKNQDVKLIWMALPNKDSFTISYTVKVDPEMQGTFDINGKFSYIEENERKDILSPIKKLKVLQEKLITDITKEEDDDKERDGIIAEQLNTENGEEELVVEELIDEYLKEEALSAETMQEEITEKVVTEENGILVKRTVKSLEAAKYEVTLEIDKGDFQSFGKVEEYLPPNYTASALENKEGMFSFNNKVMKILWMTLPPQKTITVKYLMESTSDEQDEAIVHGVFSFLDEDESKQIEMKPTTFKNTYEAQIANIEDNEEEEEEIAMMENDQIEDNSNAQSEVLQEKETESNQEEQLMEEITNIPAPESSVTYKVQIAAARREVSQQYFIDRHGILESVAIEYHNDWYKYTVGGYNVYRQARDKRNDIWVAENKIKDAFVTAYNSGERISVQEALMITKQSWVK